MASSTRPAAAGGGGASEPAPVASGSGSMPAGPASGMAPGRGRRGATRTRAAATLGGAQPLVGVGLGGGGDGSGERTEGGGDLQAAGRARAISVPRVVSREKGTSPVTASTTVRARE